MPLMAASDAKEFSMKVKYRNSLADLLRFNIYTFPRVRGIQLMAGLVVVILGYTALFSTRGLEGPLFAKVVAGVVLFLGSIFFVLAGTTVVSLLASVPSLRKAVATERTVTLSDASVVEESAQCRHETSWPGVHKVCQTRHAVLIYFSDRCAHVIPKRVFDSRDTAEQFYRYAAQRYRVRDAA
jgi:hypothetical protein